MNNAEGNCGMMRNPFYFSAYKKSSVNLTFLKTLFNKLPPTVNAHTHIDWLTPGQYAYFTHEVITKDGGQGVSQIEKIMVK